MGSAVFLKKSRFFFTPSLSYNKSVSQALANHLLQDKAKTSSITDTSAHYFGQHSQIFQCMHRVDIMCKVPTVALILVTNLADLRLWTEFYLLKLMDLMVNTKQNMMKIRSLSNCW